MVLVAAFRIFRIRITGLNSNNHMYLALSGVEFYGQVTPFTGPAIAATPVPPSVSRSSFIGISRGCMRIHRRRFCHG